MPELWLYGKYFFWFDFQTQAGIHQSVLKQINYIINV